MGGKKGTTSHNELIISTSHIIMERPGWRQLSLCECACVTTSSSSAAVVVVTPPPLFQRILKRALRVSCNFMQRLWAQASGRKEPRKEGRKQGWMQKSEV